MSSFTPDMTHALAAPLLRENVKSRSQSGRSLSYLEGWKVIEEANRIFGFDGWTRETTDIRMVSERPREIGAQKKPGWGVSYVAKVRVVVHGVVREGFGAGHGIDVDCGLAHESAIKEAETDGMKRALMSFGNPFGLALYDKEQTNVVDAPTTTDLLSAAERSLEAAALEGMEALKTAWTRLDVDLKPALKARLEVLKKQTAQHEAVAA